MTAKSTLLVLSVLFATSIATISAQSIPDHTYFTNPVGDGIVYTEGQNTTFSWAMTCRDRSMTQTPSSVEVQLVNSNNPNAVFFVASAKHIDCESNSIGNEYWVIPEVTDHQANYSLRIMLNNPAYSGQFKIRTKIEGGNGGNTGGNTSGGSTVANPGPSNEGNVAVAGNQSGNTAGPFLAPVGSLTVAAVAAVALLFL
ncbi:hypothetical protein FBU30_006898 [Linnemannia zychae]|nr:hypothetical protein FBU30_006898 [Linnemannia zychae]